MIITGGGFGIMYRNGNFEVMGVPEAVRFGCDSLVGVREILVVL